MTIKIIHGDITVVDTDAIVNAANTSLLGGGGVDGAIHRAGGHDILAECINIRIKQGGCNVGDAVITNAGKLKARYVIHTVGPTWVDGKSGEQEKLRSCYTKSLQLAEEKGLKSIAFPNISTGIYRFPKREAARIALDVVRNYPYTVLKKILFVCYDEENYDIYQEFMRAKNN